MDQTAPDTSALDEVEIFTGIGPDLKAKLAECLTPRALAPNEMLFREGSPGDALYLIRSGHVTVFIQDRSFGLTLELAQLGAGQAVGEMALVSDATRSASVRAIDRVELLALSKAHFHALIKHFPAAGLQVAGVLARRLEKLNRAQGIQFGSLRGRRLDRDLMGMVSTSLIKRHRMVPIERAGQMVTLATPDPGNLLGLDDFRRVLRGMDLRVMAVSEADWTTFSSRYLGDAAERDRRRGAFTGLPLPKVEYNRTNSLPTEGQEGGPVITPGRGPEISKLVTRIFVEGIEDSASDILIEPDKEGVRVRYRVHGQLVDRKGEIPLGLHSTLASRIKVLANMDITERRLPQDGRISLNMGPSRYDLRVATVMTPYGEKFGIRILDSSKLRQSLDALIVAPNVAYLVRNLFFQPGGLVMVTGPTGSGKTTTLYSAMLERHIPEISIVTVEDPIEYDIAGISQVQVNDNVGLDFPRVLRTFVRQSPDIILVGETRDPETAHISCNAALTGHLVMTSFHTNDAFGAVVRMLGMGIEPYMLSTCLQGVVNQRLVRRVCPECTEAHVYEPVVHRNLDNAGVHLEEGTTLYQGRGCDDCHSSGYQGQIGVFEVLTVTPELKSAIAQRTDSHGLREAAPEESYLSMAKYAGFLLARGLTVPSEVIRIMPGEEEHRR